jgi:polyisoprenoid-binding protein YceI
LAVSSRLDGLSEQTAKWTHLVALGMTRPEETGPGTNLPSGESSERADIAVAEVERPAARDESSEAKNAPMQVERHAISFGTLLARPRRSPFNERTKFTIATGSSVAFDGSSSLHDFTGTTTAVRGSIELDFSRPADSPAATVIVDAATLDTMNDDRDRAMHEEHLQSVAYPEITFTVARVDDVRPQQNGNGFQATAHGAFSIHGIQKDVSLSATIEKRPGRRLLIEAQCPLRMSDFGIEPPTALAGLIKTRDEVVVRARLFAEVKP